MIQVQSLDFIQPLEVEATEASRYMNYNVGKSCLNFSSDSKSLTFIIILTTTTVTIIKMPLRLTFFVKSLRVSANLSEEEMFVTLSNKQQKIVNQW